MKEEALLIVDMSNDFVADEGTLTVGRSGQKIVPYIVETAAKFLKNDGTVIVTMDSHQQNDPHFELWPPHNVVDSVGQKLFGELNTWYEENKDNKNLHYVPKADYNAFFRTELGELLRSKEIKKVHVTGVATDICVFLTTAGADSEGFKTAVHKRGVATFTANHELFLNHMCALFHTEIID